MAFNLYVFITRPSPQSPCSKYKHEIFWIRQHGYTVVRRTRDCHSNPSFRQVLEVPCLHTLHAREGAAAEALKHHHLWGTEQPWGICKDYTQDWAQQTEITALTSHPISPRGVRAQATLHSQQGGTSRDVPSSSVTLASSFLLYPLACVSKDAYWDREINTLHCQKATKRRLLQPKKWQACDTAGPAKGTDL